MILPDDHRVAFFAPHMAERSASPLRLERFPKSLQTLLAGQIGPLANLRSSSGCALIMRSDSPFVDLHLARLRHHQMAPCGLAIEVIGAAGIQEVHSPDLRERDGDITLRFPTGLQCGQPCSEIRLWLPLISTCAIAGVDIDPGARLEPAQALSPRWLALGDSLTQGFSVQSPLQNWVHRLSRRWDMPVWNLGVGGLLIQAEVFAWALAHQPWPLVTIALGSNHSWRESDVGSVERCAHGLAQIALAGGPDGQAHGRIIWMLPPYKPCEDGLGPAEFAGMRLDVATGARAFRVRETLRACLAEYAPRIEVIGDLMPHDHRLLLDGLHPSAFGFARFANNLATAMALSKVPGGP
jgi:lysophospholipase L1-like esterase